MIPNQSWNWNENSTKKRSATFKMYRGHFCSNSILKKFQREKCIVFFSPFYPQFVYRSCQMYNMGCTFTYLPFQQYDPIKWWKRMLKAFHCLLHHRIARINCFSLYYCTKLKFGIQKNHMLLNMVALSQLNGTKYSVDLWWIEMEFNLYIGIIFQMHNRC